jgi:tetratricopeptide (TPR) repeat protein
MTKRRKAYALLIGVGKDLPVTKKDAKALAGVLGTREFGGYYKKNITLLTGKKATRKGILNAFDKLLDTIDEDSSVFLYYSGHGGSYSDNTFIKDEALHKPEEENQKYFHLCPYDYDPKNYETTWIKAEEIKFKLQQLKSRRLIFFLDCCHAAGMTSGVSTEAGQQPRLTNADGLAQNIDDGRGMSIVSACRADQLSYILEGDVNSVFTKCLLEVLKGEDKNELDDPFVRISEVVTYIFKRVPEEIDDQNPYANLQIFDNFIVSYVDKSNSEITEPEDLDNEPQTIAKEPVIKFRETENSNSAVLFIHGFSGEAERTFSEVPKLLMSTDKMDGWDLFPVGYSGNIVPEMGKNVWACASDIRRNSDYLVTSIKNRFGKYKRIAIVAHDLGGIVAQQALLDLNSEDINRISHLLFFGTPSNGLPEVSLENFMTYDDGGKDLKEASFYIRKLRNKWDETFPSEYPFTFKTVAATTDQYVPLSSSLEPFPKKYHEMVDGDHFTMVQVEDENDDCYQLIVNTLTNQSFLNSFSNKEEINIAMGKYSEVIKKLLPNLQTLDSRGLEQLVYALEGAGREDEAIKILEEHVVAKENSNLLGIMGGRYKRAYLITFSADDLTKSFEHYKKALKIAEPKKDYTQIYYHAINLAFLSLLKGERAEMTTYADLAFNATKKDSFDSLWKNATIAECYLYKGDFDNARKFYALAAKAAGIREKISIHSNAFTAYKILMNTEDDDFIKFLKVNYLS